MFMLMHGCAHTHTHTVACIQRRRVIMSVKGKYRNIVFISIREFPMPLNAPFPNSVSRFSFWPDGNRAQDADELCVDVLSAKGTPPPLLTKHPKKSVDLDSALRE